MGWLIIAAILFVIILVPYLIFPLVLRALAGERKAHQYALEEKPEVEVIFAAYNEEKVIKEKLLSVLNCGYPKEKIRILVGSDLSSDATDDLVREVASEHPNVELHRMEQRSGKSAIINYLMELCKADFVIGTDANIFFEDGAIERMIAPLQKENIDLVGGHLIYRGLDKEKVKGAISDEEQTYIQWENRTKQIEGMLYGASMGVEGGCYAIKRKSFRTIPAGTLMEDFFLTLTTLKRGKKVVMAMDARCSEDVSQDPEMEFKRKVRISQGNWQNTMRFYDVLWKKPLPVGVLFLCHKLLRWKTPFLGITLLLSLYFHSISHPAWWPVALLGTALLFFGLYAPKLGLKNKYIGLLSHFLWMNMALFLGFFKYLKEKEAGIWEPTTRTKTE